MKKLASNLPLQDMIRSVIANATEKLAADDSRKDEKVKKLISSEKKEHGHLPSEKEEREEYEKEASIVDPGYVEKLASACDFIAANIDKIEVPAQGVLSQAIQKLATEEKDGAVSMVRTIRLADKPDAGLAAAKLLKPPTPPPSMPPIKKLAEEGSPQGAGKGPGALEVSKAIGGVQKYKKDKPATEDAAASTAGKPMHGAHPGDGSTQLDNNLGKAPGGANYPEKGPLVNLKTAGIKDLLSRYGQYMKGGQSKYVHGDDLKRAGNINPITLFKHRKEHPEAFREALTSHGARAGTAAAAIGTEEGIRHGMKKSAAEFAREHILSKLAGEDVMKANISAARNADPLPGGGELTVTDSTQKGPKQPGDPTGGFGNQGRKYIASNAAAIGYTKGDAKGPQKTQLKEVLDEPALSKRTDSKLQENLRNAGSAGVKIAAAKALLEKIASEGCQCTSTGECAYCRMKSAIRTGSEKTAQMGGMGGMGGMGASAGGMGAMADAGAGADGCTCGNTGECRICKLKAALAAAKAQGSGDMADAGSMQTAAPPSVAPMGGTY